MPSSTSCSEKGLRFKQRLAVLEDTYPDVVGEVRGEGLMLGLRLRTPPADFAAAARAEHVLVIPAGDNVVRLLPPLVISHAEISEGVARLDATCRRMSQPAELRRGAAE